MTSPFEELNLSVRTINALDAEGIATVDQLCRMQEQDFLRIRNLGYSSLAEVKRGLAMLGRRMGEPARTARKVVAAWRGAGNVIEQDAIFMVFDDGSVVAWSHHSQPEVLLRPEQIEAAFAAKPQSEGGDA